MSHPVFVSHRLSHGAWPSLGDATFATTHKGQTEGRSLHERMSRCLANHAPRDGSSRQSGWEHSTLRSAWTVATPGHIDPVSGDAGSPAG